MDDGKAHIDVEFIVRHWVETSDDDFNTMLILCNSNKYGWSLFLGHISVEKLLKALYVKRFEEHAPFTHNLFRLGELIELEMSDEYADWLDEMTSFNLNARYDDYKKEFYNLCTYDYAQKWIERIKIIRSWLKSML